MPSVLCTGTSRGCLRCPRRRYRWPAGSIDHVLAGKVSSPEKPVLQQDEIKVGAYICKGCGLGERLDCGQLATIAEREGKANLVREHDFLCNAEGVAMIQNDIDGQIIKAKQLEDIASK